MNEINVFDIKIPIFSGNVGINCSGGTDSSLLLYILMANKKDLIHIFTMANNKKCRATAIVSSRVIEKIIQLTGNSNIEHHVRYVERQTPENIAENPIEFVKNNLITCWYSGLTANPSKEITESFGKNTCHHLRDPLFERKVISESVKKVSPFTNIDKKRIADLYKKLGLEKALFPLTRSCEVENRLDYLDHCEECWWCKERKWGFSELINEK
jgi:7-cyano-7-deazaguanine synthase in queuosine biosynthesis